MEYFVAELFYTERSHVRNLKVMYQVFYRPMMQQDFVPNDLVRLLFPNLHEVIEVHGKQNSIYRIIFTLNKKIITHG